MSDVFAVQEDLTHSIVSSIAPHIQASEFEKIRRRRPESLVAYELAVRARVKGWEAYLRSDRALREEAIADARAALAIDGTSTIALVTLAFVQWQKVHLVTSPDVEASWEDGMAAASRAIETDRSDALAYMCKGLLLLFAPGRVLTDDALQNLRRSYQINSHDTGVLAALAMGETSIGNGEVAIGLIEQALSLSPRDQTRYSLLLMRLIACVGARHYTKGVESGLRGLDEFPNSAPLRTNLAMCYVGLGDIVEARRVLEEARHLEPDYVRRGLEGRFVFRKPEDLRRVTIFLRIAAGIEDAVAADDLR